MMQRKAGKFAGVVFWVSCAVFGGSLLSENGNAQSSDVAFPTAITENLISGVIKARDIGDPRLTTYYYTFNGLQGDLFINVVTKNLSGSVDVFASEGMRSLTNIVVYADVAQNETGRVIYLRKPEKLILRVQGRTPNDDPAEFQIKFAGGFEAAAPSADEPPVPKVTDVGENNSGVRVNSVGTIIAVVTKPKPTPRATPAEIAKAEQDSAEPTKSVEEKSAKEESAATKTAEKPPETAKPVNSKEDVKEPVSEAAKINAPKPKVRKPAKPKADQATTNVPPSDTDTKAVSTKTENKRESAVEEKRSKPQVVITDTTVNVDSASKKEPPTPKPNPLANVNLVILFKDGRKVERPMTQVLRFTVDQTTLTVISSNGRVAKYSILEVASVTIQ